MTATIHPIQQSRIINERLAIELIDSDPLANRRQSRHGNSGGSSSSSSTTGGVHHAPPGGSRNTTCGYASGGTWNSALTEDEMADIVHRLLTQICEQQMARFEGRNDVPLII